MNDHSHFDVVVAGLAVADIIGRPVDLKSFPRPGGLKFLESVTLTTGGNVSNVGIDLAKLGFRTSAITRVGNDSLGRFIVQHYRAHGMDTEGVIVDANAQTSATMVCVGPDGERSFLHTRGCMANFRAQDVLDHIPLIRKAKVLAFGYLGLLPETEKEFGALFQAVKEKTSVKILLDTGGHPHASLSDLKKFLPMVDFFFPSYEEAAELTGKASPEEIVRFLQKAGAAGIVGVKLGSKGVYLAKGTTAWTVKAPRVRKVVDATGAGDAFVAGFLAATLKGFGTAEAARKATAIAASCVTAVGASTAIKAFENY
ncbi:MAG: carbohydrate kinase family protein [Bacteroidota bacterium]